MTEPGAKFHRWTDEERAIIRRDYTGTKQSARDIASRLSQMTGENISEFAVAGQLNSMGIRGVFGRPQQPPWTDAETEYLRAAIGRGVTIQSIGTRLGKSAMAVKMRAQHLGISRRARTGWFTKTEVAEILGVEHKRVQRWIDAGDLKATYQYGTRPTQHAGLTEWHIEEEDLKQFLLNHSMELTGRNVDLFQIVSILRGERNPPKEWHSRRRTEAEPKTEDGSDMLAQSYWIGRETSEIWGEIEPSGLETHTKHFKYARDNYADAVNHPTRSPRAQSSTAMYFRGRVDAEIDALKELGMTNEQIAQLNPRRNPDEDIRHLQERVNALIDERRRYGVRKVTAGAAGVTMGWSNSGYWIFFPHVFSAGTVLELDANEIFVADANAEDLEFLAEGRLKYLKPLPLWGGSLERSGSPDYTGVELPPMIRFIRDQGLPRTDAVDEALRRKAEESNPSIAGKKGGDDSRRTWHRRSFAFRSEITPPEQNVKVRKIGEYFDGEENVWIFLVNGRQIRDHLYQDFTQGNHHFRWNRIPENEIWIDDANYSERMAIVQHEVHERNLMKFKKLSYSTAHERANRKEKEFR